jgi:hypothetical protein
MRRRCSLLRVGSLLFLVAKSERRRSEHRPHLPQPLPSLYPSAQRQTLWSGVAGNQFLLFARHHFVLLVKKMESEHLITLGDTNLIPYRECSKGSANVDGRCIQGGYLVPKTTQGPYLPEFGSEASGPYHSAFATDANRYAMGCAAYPVLFKNYVPYFTGGLTGTNYNELKTLNFQTKLLRPLP